MKLIFLYGPPGVGKLTVAKELAKITGFKILHNHLTVDLVETIFEFGSAEFMDLVGRYRLDLIERAAKHKLKGMIFTMVYAYAIDDWYMLKVKKLTEKYGGKTCFVQLLCSKTELLKRIKNPSRRQFNKIKKARTLKQAMQRHEFFKTYKTDDSLTIDNTDLSPKKAAQKIIDHYQLKKVNKNTLKN